MLLQVKDLKTHFFIQGKTVKAVDGVSFDIDKGEILGIIGESGCGKSVSAMSILNLVPKSAGRVVGGEIWYKDKNLLDFSPKEMQKIRGNEISLIFQEPIQALDPVYTIGNHLYEALSAHQKISKEEARVKAVELLRLVDIPSPEIRMGEYAHQFSGGMAQRAMIAIALACNPHLLIADEPTTALDVTIQAGILDLIVDLRNRLDLAIILITHNLGIVAQNADRICIMYAGRIVEQGRTADIFKNPSHPYTQELLRAVPRLDLDNQKLQEIEGTVPNLADLPEGCKFHPRCRFKTDKCTKEEPLFLKVGEKHQVKCFLRGRE
ncbi:peptide ABC transporter ATP-binding protein [Candidatus Falkowbacteria bacterium RIFOXYB2_FULL_34_18]|uniref:Peptide ABC transporter ATP-binding protein n=1 Tax=Candidatus Falkowbacteria bacterium RIFOXYD2_FULL_34_120 TaxID=1798007 RepID=A0A1F5TTD4_9BACT|nr:MAG: peptide ABC transporter ATP-binding protein [Candidatus Falkowbacteria bacterium RIFOXYB2_FULL_34_18]OGF30086.1 MAG: peptide ABC transporter ATP-binding protein [Candidatus Falkowbacteria bacterium RIFOXYC12_FULL_34_55]OGF37580.1 MAG: peptide ABC transporter ATP-binding protein [Candidatus Falkowbacteria bacterium RIFOXYC2_FULL_34_220]OGF39336.1 MAG: peptide ABC transporter ATP-binding protein [Candidatus Falkowbacteria bacterium RIFOXYD12_FULL_34_57]OGF41841.1 MAG: peptide ABC transpor